MAEQDRKAQGVEEAPKPGGAEDKARLEAQVEACEKAETERIHHLCYANFDNPPPLGHGLTRDILEDENKQSADPELAAIANKAFRYVDEGEVLARILSTLLFQVTQEHSDVRSDAVFGEGYAGLCDMAILAERLSRLVASAAHVLSP